MKDDAIIVGVALDNPNLVTKGQQRYDVGLIVEDEIRIEGLEVRVVKGGKYAIFEVIHTLEAIQEFWVNFKLNTRDLVIDENKVVIERYTLSMLKDNKCEICIPVY